MATYSGKLGVGCQPILYRNHALTWHEYWELGGLSPARTWLKGLRAQQDDVPEDLRPCVREATSISTGGIVLLLLGEASVAKRGSRRQRALGMLQAFFIEVLGPVAASTLLAYASVQDEAQLCRDYDAVHRQCSHSAEAFKDAWAHAGPPPCQAAVLLWNIFSQSTACEAAKRRLRSIVESVTESIVAAVPELGWSSDVAHAMSHVLGPSGQKRKLDEDFKEAVVKRSLGLGHAHSVHAWLRVSERGDSSSASRVIDESLVRYMAAVREANNNVERLSIALDGSKLGQPLEETEVYLCWNPAAKLCFVAPPQVQPTGYVYFSEMHFAFLFLFRDVSRNLAVSRSVLFRDKVTHFVCKKSVNEFFRDISRFFF